MMMHLAGERVKPDANNDCEVPELAISTHKSLTEASAKEGDMYFQLQIEGLIKFARERLDRLQYNLGGNNDLTCN